MKVTKNLNADKIVSFSAIFISLLTLFVSVYQTSIIRTQQRLSVLPYLSLGNYNTGGAKYRYVLKNDGIGPAFIEKVEVSYQGKLYSMDLPSFLGTSVPSVKEIKNLRYANIFPGKMIPAGITINMLEIRDSKEDGMKLKRMLNKLYEEGMVVRIVYKSIYEEHWELSTDSSIPKKL